VDPKIYSFDVGLVKITTYRKKKRVQPLPPTSDIHPSMGKMEERLRAIIDLKAFESILLEVLRPDVKDRTLLVPVRFRQRLARLRIALRTALVRTRGNAAEEIDSLLGDLEKQLSEGSGHSELLEQYRLMILMG
jgi:hypothetical protein